MFTFTSQFQKTKGSFQTCIWSNDVPLHLHDLHSYTSHGDSHSQICKKNLKDKDFTTPQDFTTFPRCLCKAEMDFTQAQDLKSPHTQKLHKKDNIIQHCTNNQVWEWTHTKMLKSESWDRTQNWNCYRTCTSHCFLQLEIWPNKLTRYKSTKSTQHNHHLSFVLQQNNSKRERQLYNFSDNLMIQYSVVSKTTDVLLEIQSGYKQSSVQNHWGSHRRHFTGQARQDKRNILHVN